MFRFLIGSEAGTPATFSAPFPGGLVSLTKPSQLFVVSPSHIAAPPMAPTTAISNKIPFITPAPISFLIPSFVRASIATIVRTSVRDGARCKVCRARDGLEWRLPQDAEAFGKAPGSIVPDPDCEGAPRCRCGLLVRLVRGAS